MTDNIKTLSVNCPTCKKEVLMTADSPYRPFCCQRCQQIDFGDWAGEHHKIEGPSLYASLEENIDNAGLSEDEFWSEEQGKQDSPQ